ncbi:MAG: hypothetical protein K2L96_02435 [Muribaculaceae bacterium]|nr:hypothetical protein [Muribaculaceae bacterium]
MNWQLAAVYVIIALAVAAFVRIVFFKKNHGCDCCEHRDKGCPGCARHDSRKDCESCHKNHTGI